MIFECPGSKRFKHPEPEMVKCPSCGEDVEIWTDEVSGKCQKCGTAVMRKGDQNCLDWCKYAKECIGDQAYEKYKKSKKKE